MTSSWQLEVKMKATNIYETGKRIYVNLLWNITVLSSLYATIPMRYVGLGMDSHFSLVL